MWIMYMRWTELAFLHWPVPAAVLRPLVPAALEVETWDGMAWLGIVPFRMEDTRYRWAPSVPTASTFPEVNVRTYVRGGGRTGVWFLSLDAASRLAVRGARTLLNLPYFHAAMSIRRTGEDTVYESIRSGTPDGLGVFSAVYRATGPEYHAEPGTFDHWLTERYCLFGEHRTGTVYAMDVHHAPWTLRAGVATIARNTLAAAGGVTLPDAPPVVHVATPIEVRAWLPEAISGGWRSG
jgi:uncharacterized protein